MIATTLSSLRPPRFKLWNLAIGDGLEYGHWRAGTQLGSGKRIQKGYDTKHASLLRCALKETSWPV
uniref:Uncharacterized protein n=1 Tax=Moniliophthora roreri TaxID=221103 RepID=A0A0W0FQT1_MONRR